jgi:3D (Asp-Asp-Asp) domain-containing protein
MTNPVAMIKDGVGALASNFAAMLAGIVNRIRGLPLVLAIGCQSGNDVTPTVPPPPQQHAAVETAIVAEPVKVSEEPKPIGKFSITFYYVVGEDEVVTKPVAANDNVQTELTAIAPPITLYQGGGSCEPIAEVSREFASELALQGTGKLHDGRVLNVWGNCACEHSPCFKVTENQWGNSGSGRPLQPFRTVAVDPKVVKIGSLLYVPLLEGRTMPGRAPWGGFVHDGCVVADDTGGGIDGNQLDLFVARKAYYVGLGSSGSQGSHAWARHVDVFDGKGKCERKGRVVARKSAAI